MYYVLFDDNERINLFPLTLTRSTGDLRLGVLKLRQRLIAQLNIDEYSVIVSKDLLPVYKERHSDWDINLVPKVDTIFINTRVLLTSDLITQINKLSNNQSLCYKNSCVAFKIVPQHTAICSEQIHDWYSTLPAIEVENVNFIQYPWDLVEKNAAFIKNDFQEFFYDKDNFFETEMGVTILNPYDVWLGEQVTLKPGVVIDASEGPVIIDEGATLMPNSVVIGPAYIGKNSLIKVGAKIYEGTSIGPMCKIGGEIEESIIHGYSNKQHDGFLGHSYLGEWVNIGADTNNSDLKNNYTTVCMYNYKEQKKIQTNTRFMGCVIGDHSKIGINCSINTGTVIGTCCNLYGSNLISDFIPSFSWGMAGNLAKYRVDNFIDTACIVKQRRQKELTLVEKELYKQLAIYEMTV